LAEEGDFLKRKESLLEMNEDKNPTALKQQKHQHNKRGTYNNQGNT